MSKFDEAEKKRQQMENGPIDPLPINPPPRNLAAANRPKQVIIKDDAGKPIGIVQTDPPELAVRIGVPNPFEMRDVMIDLETLGREPGCVILSIGACFFGPNGAIGSMFHEAISIRDQLANRLTIEAQTLLWWMAQDEARARILEMQKDINGSDINFGGGVLTKFEHWLDQDAPGGAARVKVWGNGAAFDLSILAAAFRAYGHDVPWRFWNERCHRTLVALHSNLAPKEPNDAEHDALSDAIAQAQRAGKILAATGYFDKHADRAQEARP